VVVCVNARPKVFHSHCSLQRAQSLSVSGSVHRYPTAGQLRMEGHGVTAEQSSGGRSVVLTRRGRVVVM